MGVIALTYNPDLEVAPDLPFVSIDRHFRAGVPCVASDNFGGGQLAAQKLLELGCQKLLFLRLGSAIAGEPDKRQAGFEATCRERSVPFDSLSVQNEEGSRLSTLFWTLTCTAAFSTTMVSSATRIVSAMRSRKGCGSEESSSIPTSK